VARAKRTDRAEARRRYRAEMAGTDGLGDEGEDGQAVAAPAPAAGRTRSATASPASPPGRLGIGAAFRQSIHPLNVRADLAALPGLVTNKALWLPILLCIVAAVLFTVAPNQITYLLMQYFLWAPPIAAVFLGGFLAPRASWLIGVLIGIAASLLFAIILVTGLFNQSMQTIMQTTQTTVDLRIAENLYPGTVVQWLVLSSVMGGLFAAGAAWYRRFLQLSNPNRGKQPAKRGGGGGGAGRSRSSGAAKTR
jgi:hypothetical protein